MTSSQLGRYVLGTALVLIPAASGAWPVLVPETQGNNRAFAVVTDANSDVIVSGRTPAAGGDDDGIVCQLGGDDGAVAWRHALDGTALPGPGGEDVAAETLRSLAIIGSGDVVAAGLVVNLGTGPDVFVTRRAALDGSAVWEATLDGGANLADDAQAVAVDVNGDVVATGSITVTGAMTGQPVILKLDGDTGAETWRVPLAGDDGIGRALFVEPGGDVVMAGDVGPNLLVSRRAAADGAEVWRTDVVGEPGEAVARAVARRSDGGVVVAGRLFTATTGRDFTVVSLAADGVEQWRYGIDGTAVDAADLDEAFGVGVDAAGDVVAAGVTSNAGTGDDLVVVKLAAATGLPVWRVDVDGSNNRDDDASALALDSNGDVAVVGSVRNAGTGRDLVVMLLDGATGAERWRRTIDGATSQADIGYAVTVDAADDVIAAGRTRNGDAADGMTVLKLSHATGGDFPCGTGTVETGEACDDGNALPGDGCRPDCTVEACGDGILDPQEGCDDGNPVAGDCCDAGCVLDADGTVCDDANACTVADQCIAGECQGGVLTVCPPSNDCHDASCDPATGACSDVQKPDGRLCNDGDACTVVDQCVAGQCQAGNVLPCDDFDPCSVDSCSATSGCVQTPLESFASVTCAFDPTRIATFCFAGLPRSIERRIERAAGLVERAGETTKLGRARKFLKRSAALAEQARRQAAKKTAAGDLAPACGAALDDILVDVAVRAAALRDALTLPDA